MNSKLVLSVILAGQMATAAAYQYNAKTGALSYTFFNLSPNSCSIPYFGGDPNSNALDGSMAAQWGWTVGSGDMGFFNTPFGGSDKHPNGILSKSPLFFNQADPISAPSPALPGSLNLGGVGDTVSSSSSFDGYGNPPAIGDSWALSCGGSTLVMANLAYASDHLESHSSSAPYPYDQYGSALYANCNMNPTSTESSSGENYNAMGFTENTLNFNDCNTVVGGMWSGLNNPNTAASSSLNFSMYPINLSAYVSNPVQSDGRSVAPIFGAHFTLAFGDPFIVSSYAAKILWYLVTNPNFSLNNDSFSTTGLNDMENALLSPSNGNSIFPTNSYSYYYTQWLLNSPGEAQSTLATLNTSANKPITHESVFGKTFSNLWLTTTSAIIMGINGLAGPEAGAAMGFSMLFISSEVRTSTGGPIAEVNSKINAAFTSTVSQPAPVSQDAPAVVNSTYSASNLLGMLLANTFVQAEIVNAEGFTNNQPNPLWSNASINTDSLCTSISVTNNLLSATCGSVNNNGSQAASVQEYANVLSTYPNSASNTQLSIWDAILTGSDISTNSNGYLTLTNPSASAFSPPVQLVNATGSTSSVNGVNATFNATAGLLSLASYDYSGATKLLPWGSSPIPPKQLTGLAERLHAVGPHSR